MKQKIAIITPTINPPVLGDFLESLKSQKNKNFHVFIVDITENLTSPFVNTPSVSFIKSENRGYADSVNRGLKTALGKGYTKFCIINDDTFFQPDFVENIHASFEKHPRSIVGGKIYYAEGFEYHKKQYGKSDLGKVIWYAGGTFDWDNVLSKHRGVDEVDRRDYDKEQETEFVTGALMLFDKEVVDAVGFWDESYFLYYEDADYCVRAAQKGVKLFYDPTVVIWHKVSQSTQGSGSPLHVRYQTRNRLRFGLKYAPLKTKIHLLKNFIFGRLKRK